MVRATSPRSLLGILFATLAAACAADPNELDDSATAQGGGHTAEGAPERRATPPAVPSPAPMQQTPFSAGELDADAICKGYVEILGPSTSTVFRPYSDATEGACRALVGTCNAGVDDTRKVLCSALEFAGVYYGNAYSTSFGGAKAIPIYGFSAPSDGNYGLRPESWLAGRTSGLDAKNLLECSGLTAVALEKAYGFSDDSLFCSGQFTSQKNPAFFRAVGAGEIRPGDFLTRTLGCNSSDGSGHVAIAASTPSAAGAVLVFETNAWKKPARFSEKTLADFPGAWSRFRPEAAPL